jgi:chemotaxis protein CheX
VTTGDELIGPFAEAVAIALREMAGVEAVVRDAAPVTGPDGFSDVSAVLRLSTGGEGYMVLSLPTATATALATRVLADAAEPDDEMVRDCAGEMANVIAGQAKTMLVGNPHHFTFSTPRVASGDPGLPPGERWVATFVSEAGEFSLHLCLP